MSKTINQPFTLHYITFALSISPTTPILFTFSFSKHQALHDMLSTLDLSSVCNRRACVCVHVSVYMCVLVFVCGVWRYAITKMWRLHLNTPLSHTHKHTHILYACTLIHTFKHLNSLSHTHKHTDILYACTLTHTFKHLKPLSHTQKHTHTYFTHALSHTRLNI